MFLFLLIMTLLMPATMIIFGALWRNHPPKRINSLYGYRTEGAMRSKETWEFANKYFARMWYVLGIILLFISPVPLIIFRNSREEVLGGMDLIIVTIQIIALIYPIYPTEKALKNNFDKNGYPVKEQFY